MLSQPQLQRPRMVLQPGDPHGRNQEHRYPDPLPPGAGGPQWVATQRAKGCCAALWRCGSGVQNVEDANAAAGPALLGRLSRQTAVREVGAVWHSGHFSTSIKPAFSTPRGPREGRVGGTAPTPCSPGCGCPASGPHPARDRPCQVPLGPAPPAGERRDAPGGLGEEHTPGASLPPLPASASSSVKWGERDVHPPPPAAGTAQRDKVGRELGTCWP